MRKQQKVAIAVGAGLLALFILAVILHGGRRVDHLKPDPVGKNETPATFMQMVDLNSAPADVQAAAERLKTSRVGYAMVKPDRTYLIISTGSPRDRVQYDRAEGQPDMVNPSFVDIHLVSSLRGENLLLGTTTHTGAIEYQFDVDGKYADIPTLHNRHNLELMALDAATGFTLVTVKDGGKAGEGNIRVEGYARVFEAQFTATVMTAKGRVLGWAPIMAAAGAPNWGSFVADIAFDTTDIPDTGFLVLKEEMTGAELVVPISLKQRAPQLG